MSGVEVQWIRNILLEYWDPIGGVPADEYDSYIPGIMKRLETSGTHGLADHLLRLERSAMGVPEPSVDRARETAEKLFQFYKARSRKGGGGL